MARPSKEVEYGSPIEATREALVKLLEDRPLLWVGAGTSYAAGCPSTQALVEARWRRRMTPFRPRSRSPRWLTALSS